MSHDMIPDFMQGYYEACDLEGKGSLNILAHQYSDEKATFLQTTYVEKQEFLKDWNRKTGQRKELSVEDALAPMRQVYSEKAEKIASRHGYEEEQDYTPRQAFASNLKSMRDRSHTQQARPRH